MRASMAAQQKEGQKVEIRSEKVVRGVGRGYSYLRA